MRCSFVACGLFVNIFLQRPHKAFFLLLDPATRNEFSETAIFFWAMSHMGRVMRSGIGS
jgi:hypothetical protein